MSNILNSKIVDGIRCFSPEVANDYSAYPDNGFDLTDKHAASSFWVSSRNRLFKRMVQIHMLPTDKTKLLEIGCGTGDFIREIVSNKDLQITGSEIYLKGLRYAKMNLPSVDFIQFDVSQGQIGEQFDIITAFDVIEHIENDIAALSNILQMLNKGGILILSVPQHMFMWSNLDEIVKHKRRYSRAQLVAELKECGFDISYITSFVFFLFPLMLIARMLDKRQSNSDSCVDELEKRVRFPVVINNIFDFLMRIDEALIKLGISLPFGGTLLVVARRNT